MAEGFPVLVVTAEAITDDAAEAVAQEVRRAAGDGDARAFVVAPALVDSALKYTMGDVDDAIPPARERLERSLQALGAAGIEARGEVGDSDPVQAITDELQKFDFGRIILVDHADPEDSVYGEKQLLDRVRANVSPPVTELRVHAQNGREQVAERRMAPAGAQRADEGRRFSENFPPIRSRDGLGLLIGAFATIAMLILASACPDATGHSANEFRDEVGPCTWVFLIAGGFFLINIAHVVALILMESVKYRGPFERLFSRMSIYATPLGLLAVIAIMAIG
ncbi:MAG TPA: hypothetical protein VE523_11310 [Solirubrobacterales bacterium]|jgi:hypothetical protein|nr:hypothetical protein [Solirubrobacterales bacterium]